jgi:AraC-like DNA-binding protein
MSIRAVRIAEATAQSVPGAPYYAHSGPIGGTGPYRPDYVELLAVTAGRGRRVFLRPDGSLGAEPLRAGQMFLFRPMDVQELFPFEEAGLSISNVSFPFASWERFVAAAELDSDWFTTPTAPRIEFDPDDPTVLAPFERALERFWKGATSLDLIEFLAVTIERFIPDTQRSRAGAPLWLNAAMTAMTEEENLRSGVPRFLELAHVSPGHLWRCTQRYFGLSPTDVVIDLQLRHAARLLNSTREPIGAIGERCGFATASYFSKAFRRHHGMSPREYRDQSRSATAHISSGS